MGLKGAKSPHKMSFSDFSKNLINSDIYAFLLQRGQWSFNFSQKQHDWEKSGS